MFCRALVYKLVEEDRDREEEGATQGGKQRCGEEEGADLRYVVLSCSIPPFPLLLSQKFLFPPSLNSFFLTCFLYGGAHKGGGGVDEPHE